MAISMTTVCSSNNVADLFVLADGDYQDFLDQLTGAEHANYLQSVLWSTRTIKRTITERMECDAAMRPVRLRTSMVCR